MESSRHGFTGVRLRRKVKPLQIRAANVQLQRCHRLYYRHRDSGGLVKFGSTRRMFMSGSVCLGQLTLSWQALVQAQVGNIAQ
jgi:hypothetical protein